MKLKTIIVSVLCVSCVFLQADLAYCDSEKTTTEDAKAPADTGTTTKAETPTTVPAEAPAGKASATPELVFPPKLPDVAATVGKEPVSGKDINEEVARVGAEMQKQLTSVPPEQQMMAFSFCQKQLNAGPQQVLDNKIFKILLDAYIDENNVPCPEDKVKALRKQFADSAEKKGTTLEKMMAEKGATDEVFKKAVQWEILQDQTTSSEKIEALVKEHPEYFNGTRLQTAHVLIPCGPMASTADQKEALEKIKKIRADIEAKKITFEEAAVRFSSCPSRNEGGNLPEFTTEKMALGFSIAAFDLKPGQISPIVRTRFGFHIIQLIKRTDGTKKINPAELSDETEKLAKGILMSQMQDKIMDLGMTKLPIVINK